MCEMTTSCYIGSQDLAQDSRAQPATTYNLGCNVQLKHFQVKELTLLGGHLHIWMMMTLPTFIKRCIELHIHVSPTVRLSQRRRHPMHTVAALDHSLASQRGDTARLVVGTAAFGAVHFDFFPEELAILLHLLG